MWIDVRVVVGGLDGERFVDGLKCEDVLDIAVSGVGSNSDGPGEVALLRGECVQGWKSCGVAEDLPNLCDFFECGQDAQWVYTASECVARWFPGDLVFPGIGCVNRESGFAWLLVLTQRGEASFLVSGERICGLSRQQILQMINGREQQVDQFGVQWTAVAAEFVEYAFHHMGEVGDGFPTGHSGVAFDGMCGPEDGVV